MSTEWTNRVGNGGTPFVTVECWKCSGKAIIEKVFEGTNFRHCGSVEPIPPEVFATHTAALANFKAGKPAAGKFAVRYI